MQEAEMNGTTRSTMVIPLSGDFFAVSKLLVTFAQEEEEHYKKDLTKLVLIAGVPEGERPNLVVSPARHPMPVERDGPGGAGNGAGVQTMTLRTLDGGLFLYNNGKMAEKGLFEYEHRTKNDYMNSVLKIGESPSLVPASEQDHTDGIKLTKQEEPSTPTSESAHLTSKKFGYTLALDLSAIPPELISVSDYDLKLIMEKKKLKGRKINPLIKIRQTNMPLPQHNGNNIALYFESEKHFYYVHIDKTTNPPTLKAQPIDKSQDPHSNFIQHLQFMEKPVNCKCEACANPRGEEECDHEEPLESVHKEEDETNSGDDSGLVNGFRDLHIDRSQSEGSTPVKPATLRLISEPSTLPSFQTKMEKDKSDDNDKTDKLVEGAQEPMTNGRGGDTTEILGNGSA